jgi:hypothetical protein
MTTAPSVAIATVAALLCTVLRVPFDHRCDGGEGTVTDGIPNCIRSGNLQTGTVLRPKGPGQTDSTLFIRFSKSHVCRCVSVPAPGWE